MKRRLPNILITGTPGTGKSTLSEEISTQASMEHINIGDLAKDHHLYEEYDEDLACHVLAEEKVVQELEDGMGEGGKIIDYHGCDFFPEDWFDIIFVLTTDNTILYDRLVSRGYSGKKLENNIQCEIFQTLLQEAKESYNPAIVFKLDSNTPEDMESNIEQIVRWVDQFVSDHREG